jgi:hypothetical protein
MYIGRYVHFGTFYCRHRFMYYDLITHASCRHSTNYHNFHLSSWLIKQKQALHTTWLHMHHVDIRPTMYICTTLQNKNRQLFCDWARPTLFGHLCFGGGVTFTDNNGLVKPAPNTFFITKTSLPSILRPFSAFQPLFRMETNHSISPSPSVWPDWAKFRHFGEKS